MGKFEIGREPRENHPQNMKAVLYEVVDGKKVKVGVWKPGESAPKLIYRIPADTYVAFHDEMLAIKAEEIKSGIADY